MSTEMQGQRASDAQIDDWEQHLVDQQRSWLRATHAQRLECLEGLIVFADEYTGAALLPEQRQKLRDRMQDRRASAGRNRKDQRPVDPGGQGRG